MNPTLYDLLTGHVSAQLAERNETLREVVSVARTASHVSETLLRVVEHSPPPLDTPFAILQRAAVGLSTLATLGTEAARLQRACEVLMRQEQLTTALSEARTAMVLTEEARGTLQRFLAYYNDPTSPGDCTAVANVLRPLLAALGEVAPPTTEAPPTLRKITGKVKTKHAYVRARFDSPDEYEERGIDDDVHVTDAIQAEIERGAQSAWAVDAKGKFIAGWHRSGNPMSAEDVS